MLQRPIWFEWKFNNQNFDKPKKSEEEKGVFSLFVCRSGVVDGLNDSIFVGSVRSTREGWVATIEGKDVENTDCGSWANSKLACKHLLIGVMDSLMKSAIEKS